MNLVALGLGGMVAGGGDLLVQTVVAEASSASSLDGVAAIIVAASGAVTAITGAVLAYRSSRRSREDIRSEAMIELLMEELNRREKEGPP